MSHHFALEQLDAAARELAVGVDRIRPRLARAYSQFLERIEPTKDLPPSLRDRFAELRSSLTRLGKSPAEPWAAAVGLDESEASRLAGLLIEIAAELRSRLGA